MRIFCGCTENKMVEICNANQRKIVVERPKDKHELGEQTNDVRCDKNNHAMC